MINWWQFSLLANIVVAAAFLGVSLLIIIPAFRLHLTRSKKLATATAAVFFALAVGRSLSAVHYAIPGASRAGAPVTFWWEAVWNLITAGTAIYLFSVRRLLGQLFVGSASFDEMIQRREADELVALRAESAGRLAAEEERDATAGMLRAIVANNQAAIYVKDLDGRYLLGNPKHAAIMGRPEPEFLGLTDDDIVEPALSESWRRNDLSAQHGRIELKESNNRFADGRHFYESVKFPLYDKRGQLYAVCGSSLDVTHEMRATVAVEEARDAAVAASAAKSTFLATMSHEIRTPMNAVIGMTDLLLNTELTATQYEFVDTVRFSGDALLSVINDILDFSKIESGELRIESELFSVRDEIENCLDLVVAASTAKGLDLVCYIEDGVPQVVIGDANRLRQIVVNLLSNAVKFTAAGEILLTMSAAPVVDGHVEMIVEVTDTGIGIAAEGVIGLFQSFTQVDASTTRVYGGTGLGLAISQRLAEAMNGDVTVRSIPGVGSTFTLTLTVQESPDVTSLIPPPPAADLEGLSVLLVDDNLTCLRIMDLQLSGLGMQCTTTATPEGALALLKHGYRYDIAIVDMLMPEMNGVELASALRKVPSVADAPIVLVTSVGSRPEGAEDVFSSLLAKPVKGAALQRALASALGRPLIDAATQRAEGLAKTVQPLKILLAEDNAVNQRVAQLMLDNLGHSVRTVVNGLEAVEIMRTEDYDVILMDVQMPVLDGLDATRRIRQEIPLKRQPRIIAMTASALAEDHDACAQAGMNDYLTKPVRAAELQSALARMEESDDGQPDTSAPLSLGSSLEPTSELPPAIDQAVLDELTVQVGDDSGELLHDLIESYLADSSLAVGRFVEAADGGDATTVLKVAHTLRSTSGLLGATLLVGLLHQAEKAARTNQPGLPSAARTVEAEYARVAVALLAVRHRDLQTADD